MRTVSVVALFLFKMPKFKLLFKPVELVYAAEWTLTEN